MPIYEYVCTSCASKFELLRSISRMDEEAECPQCHNGAKRVLSKFACFTTDESGMTSTIGGDSCATCTSGDCSTCAM